MHFNLGYSDPQTHTLSPCGRPVEKVCNYIKNHLNSLWFAPTDSKNKCIFASMVLDSWRCPWVVAPLNYFYPVKIEKCQGQKVAKSLGLLVATNAGLYIMLDQIPFIMIKRSFFLKTSSVTSSKLIFSQKSLSLYVSRHALSPSYQAKKLWNPNT